MIINKSRLFGYIVALILVCYLSILVATLGELTSGNAYIVLLGMLSMISVYLPATILMYILAGGISFQLLAVLSTILTVFYIAGLNWLFNKQVQVSHKRGAKTKPRQ
jgi:hypothetical protein